MVKRIEQSTTEILLPREPVFLPVPPKDPTLPGSGDGLDVARSVSRLIGGDDILSEDVLAGGDVVVDGGDSSSAAEDDAASPVPSGRVVLTRRTPSTDLAATLEPFVANLLPDVGANVDINALVQWVLRESYIQGTEDLYYFAEKVKYYNNAKQAYRDMLSELREIQTQVQSSLVGIPEEEQAGYDLAGRPTGSTPSGDSEGGAVDPAARTPEQEALVQSVLRYDYDGTTSLEQTLIDGGDGYQKILDALPYMTAEEVLQLLHGVGGDDGEMDDGAKSRFNEILSLLSDTQLLGVELASKPDGDWWDEDVKDLFNSAFDGRWPSIKANNGLPDDISKSDALAQLTAPPSAPMPTDVAGMPIEDTGWATANQTTIDVTVDWLLSWYGGEPIDPTYLYSDLLNGNDAGAAARGMWLGLMDRVSFEDVAQLLNLFTGGTGNVPPELEGFLQALIDRIPPEVLQQARSAYEEMGQGMLGAMVDARLTTLGMGVDGSGGSLDLDASDGSIDVPQFNANAVDGEPWFLPSGEKVTSIAQLDDLIEKLEGELNGLGDDAQLANVDLQNKLQQQQQVLQMLSNIIKLTGDTAMAITRNINS